MSQKTPLPCYATWAKHGIHWPVGEIESLAAHLANNYPPPALCLAAPYLLAACKKLMAAYYAYDEDVEHPGLAEDPAFLAAMDCVETAVAKAEAEQPTEARGEEM